MKENFIFTDNKRVGIGGRICVCKERFLEYGMTIIRSFSIVFDIIAIFVIAVIVNNESGITDLTSEQIKAIYTGEVTEWEDVK